MVSLKQTFFFHFLSIYGHREAIGHDCLGGERYQNILSCVVRLRYSPLIFGSRRVDSEEGSSLSLPVSGQMGGGQLCIIVNWGLPWAVIWIYFWVPLVLMLLAQRSSWWVHEGVKIRVGRLSPSVI
jgi:hypothetical protein